VFADARRFIAVISDANKKLQSGNNAVSSRFLLSIAIGAQPRIVIAA
jgi:hypothetical protein